MRVPALRVPKRAMTLSLRTSQRRRTKHPSSFSAVLSCPAGGAVSVGQRVRDPYAAAPSSLHGACCGGYAALRLFDTPLHPAALR